LVYFMNTCTTITSATMTTMIVGTLPIEMKLG
jgi:hypothetical protein